MKSIYHRMVLHVMILACISQDISSQQELRYEINAVTLSRFLSSVMEGNLNLIAGQFNVSIAEAQYEAAKIFPDPALVLSYSNNEDQTLQMGQSLETGISYPVSLGNKRGAGISLAKSQHELSRYLLESFLQNLRADAALSYFTCLRNKKIYQLQLNIYEQLSKLAKADSIRLETGEATSLDALQSSLEAKSQLTSVYQSLADLENSEINLMILQGKKTSDTLDHPGDEFPVSQRDISLPGLIRNAHERRAELLVAIKSLEVSEKNLRLLRAYRAFEFSLETGYSFNSIVRNEIAPAPAYNGLNAGIAFPLKFSNFNRNSIHAAELAVKQSQVIYDEIELQITSEVIQAYNNFIAQKKKVDHYNRGLIEDADKILKGRIYSYQQGESGLLDVLNAQRTYIELQINHLESLYGYTAALIGLERAAGIWDLSQDQNY